VLRAELDDGPPKTSCPRCSPASGQYVSGSRQRAGSWAGHASPDVTALDLPALAARWLDLDIDEKQKLLALSSTASSSARRAACCALRPGPVDIVPVDRGKRCSYLVFSTRMSSSGGSDGGWRPRTRIRWRRFLSPSAAYPPRTRRCVASASVPGIRRHGFFSRRGGWSPPIDRRLVNLHRGRRCSAPGRPLTAGKSASPVIHRSASAVDTIRPAVSRSGRLGRAAASTSAVEPERLGQHEKLGSVIILLADSRFAITFRSIGQPSSAHRFDSACALIFGAPSYVDGFLQPHAYEARTPRDCSIGCHFTDRLTPRNPRGMIRHVIEGWQNMLE